MRRESCRIRWLEFLFIRRKLRRESRREKLLRVLVEGFHGACGRFETQSQENARRLIELCCSCSGIQNDLKLPVLVKRLGKHRKKCEEREAEGTRSNIACDLQIRVSSTEIEFGRSLEIGGFSSGIWQWSSYFATAASKRSQCA